MNATDYEVSRTLRKLAGRVQKDLKRTTKRDDLGFMLIVFQTEDDSRTSYISNCDRMEVIKAMKELLARWEEGMPDIPTHELQ